MNIRLGVIVYTALVLLFLGLFWNDHETAFIIFINFILFLDDLINVRQSLFGRCLLIEIVFNFLKPGLFLLGAAESVLSPLLCILLKDK